MIMTTWKNIISETDFHNIVEASHTKPQIIFKDSVTCGISAHAKHRLNEDLEIMAEKADLNYLDLLSFRPISALIAEELDVRHQSPQIIVVKDGKATYSVTHHAIEPGKVAENI